MCWGKIIFSASIYVAKCARKAVPTYVNLTVELQLENIDRQSACPVGILTRDLKIHFGGDQIACF